MMKAVIGAALLLLSAGTRLAAGEPKSPSSDLVTAEVKRFMSRYEAPSVSIAIMQNGELVLAEAFGLADVENFVPAEDETMYRIASVTKPMTAAAVLQLAESRRLDLDAPIQRYVEKFPAKYGAIAVRDLLRHTAGVRHFKEGEFATTRRCEQLEESLQIFAADAIEHAPRERVTYSTYGYVLLGLAVENVSGMKFGEYMKKHLFTPAGMTSTRTDDYRALVPNRARGYMKSEAGSIRNADLVDTSCRIPGGGLISTATDVARFGNALMTEKLLSRASVAMMTAPQVPAETVKRTLAFLKAPAGYEPPGFGYGWAIGTPGNRTSVWHGGNQQGTTSMLYLIPEKRQVIAILSNIEGEGDAIVALADSVAAILK